MSGVYANTGSMDNNGREVVHNSQALFDELENFDGNVKSLLLIWRGISANEFEKSYDAQKVNLMAFQQLLGDMGESIQRSANILNSNEEDNAKKGANLFGGNINE